MLIVSWSPYKGHSKSTTNAMLLAIINVIKHRKKILYINASNEKSAELSLFSQIDESIFSDIGIDAFLRYGKMGTIEEKFINDITFSFLRKLFHFMPTSNKSFLEYENSYDNLNFQTFTHLLNYYDNVYIDLPSGYNKVTDYFLTKPISKIINLSQSRFILNTLKDNKFSKLFTDKNILFLIGAYDESSAYSIKNISKLYPLVNKRLVAIPYNIELMDSISNSNIIEYMQNINLSGDDLSKDFIRKIDTAFNLLNILKEAGG